MLADLKLAGRFRLEAGNTKEQSVNTPDNTLITQAQAGNRRALNQLFGQWYPRVYQVGFRYFNDEDLAAEVSQQTFVAVQKSLTQLRDAEAFKGWLYRTAINCCHTLARKRTRRQTSLDQLKTERNHSSPLTPYQEMHRQEKSQIVLAALQLIPAEQREVILMKEYEGLKFREIAEILELSENTVKSRLYYGLKAMRKLLEDRKLHKDLLYE